MRNLNLRITILALLFLVSGVIAHADTYSTFKNQRFYSANNLYFLEVTPAKRATLYRTGRRLQRVWSRVLPELPGRVFITNDGRRVVLVDYYYGNDGVASANVVLFLDQAGKRIAGHALSEVANLSRVLQTTSSAHWYYGGFFTPGQRTFIVETIVRKCDPPTTIRTQEDLVASDECSVPFEELQFSLATGAVISRTEIQSKYADPEKRLLHQLELAEGDHLLTS